MSDDIPNPDANSPETPADNRNRNRLALIGIALLFITPLVIATYLNSTWTDWGPSVTRNYGDLIQPVVPLPHNDWPTPDGGQLTFGAGGKWTLLTVESACDTACRQQLGLLDNVRRALGQRGERLTQVLALASDAEVLEPTLHLGVIADSRVMDFAEQQLTTGAGLYLVDPLGNVMMHYPAGYDPSHVRKDLERLLKYSKVGT